MLRPCQAQPARCDVRRASEHRGGSAPLGWPGFCTNTEVIRGTRPGGILQLSWFAGGDGDVIIGRASQGGLRGNMSASGRCLGTGYARPGRSRRRARRPSHPSSHKDPSSHSPAIPSTSFVVSGGPGEEEKWRRFQLRCGLDRRRPKMRASYTLPKGPSPVEPTHPSAARTSAPKDRHRGRQPPSAVFDRPARARPRCGK